MGGDMRQNPLSWARRRQLMRLRFLDMNGFRGDYWGCVNKLVMDRRSLSQSGRCA